MKTAAELTPIESYMTQSREKRRAHLQLGDKCFEVGGTHSYHYWGLLAYYLGTTIPVKMGNKVHLCHACNNPKCSNVNHLYWGSLSDNIMDMKLAGTYFSPMEIVEKKRGKKKARGVFENFLYNRKGKKFPASKEHWESYRYAFDGIDISKHGSLTKIAKILDVSHTHVRRIAKQLKIMPDQFNGRMPLSHGEDDGSIPSLGTKLSQSDRTDARIGEGLVGTCNL